MRPNAHDRRTAVIARALTPSSVVLVLVSAFLLLILGSAGWDPLVLARLGELYDPRGAVDIEGYDGQFVYYIARDLDPLTVAPFLDVPAYRFQRILLPVLARLAAFGQLDAIPWSLAALGIVSQVAGTWLVERLLVASGVSRWYALTYGLFAGFTLSVRLDLPEPLAYALVAGALWMSLRGRHPLAWLLYGLALFAKEVTVLFVASQALIYVHRQEWRRLTGLTLVAGLPYLGFQFWLWWVFGAPGIGSGGANATPFELVPFLGMMRIGGANPTLLAATLVVFAPAVLLPALWGLWVTVREWRAGGLDLAGTGLLLNALVIPFLPFSTMREPGGLLRFACGLVLALLLYAAKGKNQRVLNYSVFWLVLNVFLLK